jgi:hypothetical protein
MKRTTVLHSGFTRVFKRKTEREAAIHELDCALHVEPGLPNTRALREATRSFENYKHR